MKKMLSIVLIGILLILMATTSVTSKSIYNINNKKIFNDYLNCDPPGYEWYKSYGGIGADHGHFVSETNDGGYIIVGSTGSYGSGNFDVWLIKTDSTGNMIWNQTYGGNNVDLGLEVYQNNDGGYIIAATTESYGNGETDIWLIKTDSMGNMIWDQLYGGSGAEWGGGLYPNNDRSYIIVGSTGSYGYGGLDVWLIKTDSTGNMIWNQTYGGSDFEWGFTVHKTNDNGYVINGGTNSYGSGGYDFWLIKTDSTGNMIWNQTYGGNSDDWSEDLCQTNDGGYVLIGSTGSFGAGENDIWLIKTDSLGNRIWSQTYGGIHEEGGESICQTDDNGFVFTGGTESYGDRESDIWLVKTDVNGELEWNQTYGVSGRDYANWISSTSDDSYVLTGLTYLNDTGSGNCFLIKISPFETDSPNTPMQPMGPTSGKLNEEYFFTSSTTDIDGDNVFYLFDWGDGSDSGWLGPYESGEVVEASYTWTEKGSYEIKVKAKDIHGAESEWSDPLSISIPKNKIINLFPWFQHFLEQHPLLFPILRQLL